MYELTLDKFTGPLDLLLNLVEEKKMSINEVSLSQVAEQYIVYLKSLPDISKDELASFLVIASTLMLIKSRSLLPSLALTEEEQIDVKELENRLKIYKFFKELSAELKTLSQKGEYLFGREAYVGMSYFFSPPEGVTPDVLKKTLLGVLEILPQKEDLPEDVIEKAVSLEEKMDELKDRLTKSLKFTFSGKSSVGKDKEKVEVIVGFLALLQLIKDGFLIFEQKGLFANIDVKKHE